MHLQWNFHRPHSIPCKPDNYLKPPAVPKPSLCSHLMSAFCGEVSESQDLVIFKKQVTQSVHWCTGKFYHRLLSWNYRCQNRWIKHIVWFTFLDFLCLPTHSSAKFGLSQWGSLSLVWISKFLLCFRNQIEVLGRLKCSKLSKWSSLLELRFLLNMLLLFRNNEQ